MKTLHIIAVVALLTGGGPLRAAADAKPAGDPLAGAFFPPELVLLARDRIALTPEQRQVFQTRVEQTKPRSDDLRARLERETVALAALAKLERLDEAALVAQLDKVLDAERELKRLHIGLLVAVKNLLTPGQQAQLRQIAQDGGAQLQQDARRRLTEKVERVKQGVQKWAASGRDPAAILKVMEEKFKPLIEAGKAIEAEAELDRLLDKLDEATKAPASRPIVRNRTARTDPADHFSVWISKLDGSERKLILSDPQRQMTHTRVSPDLKWIVFTTYSNPGADGFAKEGGNSYANTEICLFKLGGTEIKTIAGPVPGEVNANASFSSDGKRIIFMSTRSGQGACLYWYDIATGLTTQVPTPPALSRMSDPHEVGNRIVFPARPGEGGGLQGIWMMNRDGSEARQISFPKKSLGTPAEDISQGDYDPRLSPDGSLVTILRNVGGAFHVVLVDTTSGRETDLTEPLFPGRKQTAEGVAAWSSDGKLLVFRHIALPQDGPRGVGLYVMQPDGSGRKKIPMAKGEFPHVQPEFFPEGSGPGTRVIYQTEKNSDFNF